MTDSQLFPALLKHWRGKRGLSQLDLALAADVSARHVSFLETARSTPSPAMIHRLAQTLGVPLRSVNSMLRAAGHPPVYDEVASLPDAASQALDLLLEHHEPFPVMVVDRLYRLERLNKAGVRLLGTVLGDTSPDGLNIARLTFDPAGAQPLLVNFDEVGRTLLWRIQREALENPDDGALRALLDELLAMPTVSDDWRDVDLTAPSEPTIGVHLRAGPLELRFLTMMTAFQAPQNVALDELRIETWLPADGATAELCRALAQ